MLEGRDIVVLSDEWNGLPTSTIHIIRQMIPTNRVFWFNLVNRLPRFNRADIRKVGRVLRQVVASNHRNAIQSPLQAGPAPCVITPPMIPWFKPIVRRLNCLSLRRAYGKVCRKHDIRKPIFVSTWPSAVDFLKSISGGTKIYCCVDDWLHLPRLNASDWHKMERDLLDTSDAFIATSRSLMKKARPDQPSLYLPHGVDFEHYRGSRANAKPAPSIQNVNRPIAGYFGLIRSWVDLKCIESLSSSFPDVSFVLIGKSEVDLKSVTSRPNVHYLGWVPYSELPAYARHFDIGLMPYVISPLTQAVNPLKLYEYYALGLPVLATRLPELEYVPGPLELARNESEFHSGLQRILERGPARCREEALAIARDNTWRSRAERFSNFLRSVDVESS